MAVSEFVCDVGVIPHLPASLVIALAVIHKDAVGVEMVVGDDIVGLAVHKFTTILL